MELNARSFPQMLRRYGAPAPAPAPAPAAAPTTASWMTGHDPRLLATWASARCCWAGLGSPVPAQAGSLFSCSTGRPRKPGWGSARSPGCAPTVGMRSSTKHGEGPCTYGAHAPHGTRRFPVILVCLSPGARDSSGASGTGTARFVGQRPAARLQVARDLLIRFEHPSRGPMPPPSTPLEITR